MSNYFFDCVHKTNSPVRIFFEESLFFDGFSHIFGYRRVGWLKFDQLGQDIPSLGLFLAVAKLSVYVAYPALLVWSLIGKTICRLLEDDKSATVQKTDHVVHKPQSHFQEVDLRGKTWFSNFEIAGYYRHLKKTYPHGVFFNWPGPFNTSKELLESFETNSHTFRDLGGNWVNILEYQSILLPVHVSGNHWTLLFIDRKKRTVEYYDSKINYGNYNQIARDFQQVAEELSKSDPGENPYVFSSKIKKKFQPDGYQCGPWALYFSEKRLENPDVDFNDLDVNEAQSMIAQSRLSVMEAINRGKKLAWERRQRRKAGLQN